MSKPPKNVCDRGRIGTATAIILVALMASVANHANAAQSAAKSEGGAGGQEGPPAVNTNNHPDAAVLNARNPLAVHAGPGRPNVGGVYLPPSLTGKDKSKGAKAGQTEEAVMGTTPSK